MLVSNQWGSITNQVHYVVSYYACIGPTFLIKLSWVAHPCSFLQGSGEMSQVERQAYDCMMSRYGCLFIVEFDVDVIG